MIGIEIVGTITGATSVWLLTKQRVFGWPLGLVYIVLSMFLFWNARLYGEFIAHIVFFALSLHGWIRWKQGRTAETSSSLEPSFLSLTQTIAYLVGICALSLVVGRAFQLYTNNVLPYLDSFVMSMSFAAMWLQASKKIENWVLWMAVNALSIGMYISQALFVYAVLYVGFLALAFYGFSSWMRSSREAA